VVEENVTENMDSFEPLSDPELLNMPKPRRALMSSRKGKFMVAGGVFGLIVVVAFALFFLFGQVSPPSSGRGLVGGPSSAAAQTVQQPTTAAPSTVATVIADEPPEVALTEVFTFRDIFEPLIKPVASTGSSSESSPTPPGSNDSGSGASENSILLQDITVSNGQPTAVVVWEGETYEVQEGDQVDSSPWKVLSIESSSVVMLFGDTQVTLSVGQELSK
jgi:type IV pilus biogenesis protein PilP